MQSNREWDRVRQTERQCGESGRTEGSCPQRLRAPHIYIIIQCSYISLFSVLISLFSVLISLFSILVTLFSVRISLFSVLMYIVYYCLQSAWAPRIHIILQCSNIIIQCSDIHYVWLPAVHIGPATFPVETRCFRPSPSQSQGAKAFYKGKTKSTSHSQDAGAKKGGGGLIVVRYQIDINYTYAICYMLPIHSVFLSVRWVFLSIHSVFWSMQCARQSTEFCFRRIFLSTCALCT
jgi:hypothetical protein